MRAILKDVIPSSSGLSKIAPKPITQPDKSQPKLESFLAGGKSTSRSVSPTKPIPGAAPPVPALGMPAGPRSISPTKAAPGAAASRSISPTKRAPGAAPSRSVSPTKRVTGQGDGEDEGASNVQSRRSSYGGSVMSAASAIQAANTTDTDAWVTVDPRMISLEGAAMLNNLTTLMNEVDDLKRVTFALTGRRPATGTAADPGAKGPADMRKEERDTAKSVVITHWEHGILRDFFGERAESGKMKTYKAMSAAARTAAGVFYGDLMKHLYALSAPEPDEEESEYQKLPLATDLEQLTTEWARAEFFVACTKRWEGDKVQRANEEAGLGSTTVGGTRKSKRIPSSQSEGH